MAAGEITLQRWTKFLVGVCTALLTVVLAAGQVATPSTPAPQSPRPPAASQPDQESGEKPDADSEIVPDNPKRIFGIIPNSNTVIDTGGPVRPLTPKEKFRLVKDYFTPFTLVGSAFGAAIGQATNSQPEYGQGMEGYGKRVGADLANGFTGDLFVTGVFPSLLHEDPRYFREGQGSVSSRALYALTRVVVTRTDSGQRTFNFSQILGNLASAGIGNAYYPRDERGWQDVMLRTGSGMGGNALGFAVKEFGPDIMRKFKRKKHTQENPTAIGIPVKP